MYRCTPLGVTWNRLNLNSRVNILEKNNLYLNMLSKPSGINKVTRTFLKRSRGLNRVGLDMPCKLLLKRSWLRHTCDAMWFVDVIASFCCPCPTVLLIGPATLPKCKLESTKQKRETKHKMHKMHKMHTRPCSFSWFLIAFWQTRLWTPTFCNNARFASLEAH